MSYRGERRDLLLSKSFPVCANTLLHHNNFRNAAFHGRRDFMKHFYSCEKFIHLTKIVSCVQFVFHDKRTGKRVIDEERKSQLIPARR